MPRYWASPWECLRARTRSLHAALGAGLATGALRPVIGQELPLAEAAKGAPHGHRIACLWQDRLDSISRVIHGHLACGVPRSHAARNPCYDAVIQRYG